MELNGGARVRVFLLRTSGVRRQSVTRWNRADFIVIFNNGNKRAKAPVYGYRRSSVITIQCTSEVRNRRACILYTGDA